MAKILFGVTITDASGRTGNSVFTHSKSGPVLRFSAKAANPSTDAQQSIRASLHALAKRWDFTLTQTQRDGWIALAAAHSRLDVFANPYFISGFNMFIASNQALKSAAIALIDTAPATWTVGAPTAITITQVTATPSFSIAVTTGPGADDVPVLYATPMLAAGVAVAKTKLKKLHAFAPATAGPYDIQALYAAKFGTVLSNKLIIVQVKYVDQVSGRIGTPAQANVITS